MRRGIYFILIILSVFVISGCSINKDSASKVEEKKEEVKKETFKSGMDARDNGNSVVCIREDNLYNNHLANLERLANGQDIITGMVNAVGDDEVIGKSITQRVFVYNDENTRIIDVYYLMINEYTSDKVTTEMKEALKKYNEEKGSQDTHYEYVKATVEGNKVITDSRVKLTSFDQSALGTLKEDIYKGSSVYTCKIN